MQIYLLCNLVLNATLGYLWRWGVYLAGWVVFRVLVSQGSNPPPLPHHTWTHTYTHTHRKISDSINVSWILKCKNLERIYFSMCNLWDISRNNVHSISHEEKGHKMGTFFSLGFFRVLDFVMISPLKWYGAFLAFNCILSCVCVWPSGWAYGLLTLTPTTSVTLGKVFVANSLQPWLWSTPSLPAAPPKWSEICSIVSDSLWPYGLYSPWNSPAQNTGVGSLSLIQGIFPIQGSNPSLPHYRQILYQLNHEGSPPLRGEVCFLFS